MDGNATLQEIGLLDDRDDDRGGWDGSSERILDRGKEQEL